MIDDSAVIENSVIKEPCFIGRNAVIRDTVLGPHVSIGENTLVEGSVISNSMIQSDSEIRKLNAHNSMIGNYVDLRGNSAELSIGDYSRIKY